MLILHVGPCGVQQGPFVGAMQPLAEPVQAALAGRTGKDLQDSLPQETPQKLPGPATMRAPKTSV